MITRSSQLLALAIAITTFLASCGANELNKKAEKSATAFYSNLQKKDFDAAVSLCSDKAFKEDTKEEWKKDLEKNSVLLGEVRSFTKTSGFNIAASTSLGTTVTLTYDVQWQYGKSKDSVVLIKENDGSMKVLRYAWQHKDAEYITEVGVSEKVVNQYMDAIKAGNYDAALALCSDVALKITPKENWALFLDNATNKLGAISNYNIVKAKSSYHIAAKGDAGEGNYYDIYVKSSRAGNEVMEKIVFFQKSYDEPVKLTGHYFL